MKRCASASGAFATTTAIWRNWRAKSSTWYDLATWSTGWVATKRAARRARALPRRTLHSARQRHKADRAQILDNRPPGGFPCANQFLLASLGIAQWHHQPTALLQLAPERLWYFRRSGSQQDGVKGAFLRPTEKSVSDSKLDVAVAQLGENLFRPRAQLGKDLEGKDVRAQVGQHCRLIARAGADLEDFFPWSQL